MADFTAPASNAGSVQEGTFPVKAAIVLALAALADWLFYGHGIGISAAIFTVATACGSLLANLATLVEGPIEYDTLSGEILNSKPASNLLHREYRKGWSL